jgi:hypothetical protein
MPLVVNVGRQGLICFVGGTVFSIFADIGLHLAIRASHLSADWPIRLTGDVSEIAALLLLGTFAAGIKQARALRVSQLDRAV